MVKIYKKSLLLLLVPCVVNAMEYFNDDLKTSEQKMQSGTNNNSYRIASNQSSPALANNNLSPEVIDVESFSSSPAQSVCNTPESITKRAVHSPPISTRFRYKKNDSPNKSPIPSRKYDLTSEAAGTYDQDKKISKNILALMKIRKEEAKLTCCKIENLTWEGLMTHLNDHPRDNKNQVQCCGKSFSNKTYAADHVATKHNTPTLFQCPKCPLNYGSTEALRTHYVKCVKGLSQSTILIPDKTDNPFSSSDATIVESQACTPSVSVIQPESNVYEIAFKTLFAHGIEIGDKYLPSWIEMVNYFQYCKEYYQLTVWSCPACQKVCDSVEDACCCCLTHFDERFAYTTPPQSTIDLDELLPLDGDLTENQSNSNNNNTSNTFAYTDVSLEVSPAPYVPEINQHEASDYENYHGHTAEDEFQAIIENAELASANNHDYALNINSTWSQGAASPIIESHDYTHFDLGANTHVIDYDSSSRQNTVMSQTPVTPQVIDLIENNTNTLFSSAPGTPVAHKLPKTPVQIEIPDRKNYEHAIGIGLKSEIEKMRFERLERERLRLFSKK